MALVTPTEPVPLDELGRVHFVGIGGAGMSGSPASCWPAAPRCPAATPRRPRPSTSWRRSAPGCTSGHAAGQLGDADTLVVSSAIRTATRSWPRPGGAACGCCTGRPRSPSLMSGRRVIAVTGTHGKTTTTSMITTVLLETGAGPAYAIGGVLAATGTGAADGPGRDFVAEADESDGSFLMYAPDVAVVTNVEADHLDNYGTEAGVPRVVRGLPRAGSSRAGCSSPPPTTRAPRDLAAAARAAAAYGCVTYGESPDADYRVTGGVRPAWRRRSATAAGRAGGGRAARRANRSRPAALGVPGQHNALNAAAAFAAAVELGIVAGAGGRARSPATAAPRGGSSRRARRAASGCSTPTRTTRPSSPPTCAPRAAVAGGAGRVIAVFQPHLYSRTRIFAAEFGAALGLADEAVVLDVYAAREDPEPGVTGRLSPTRCPAGRRAYVAASADVPKVVAALAAPGDLVLTMGAGDITRIGPLILAEIAARGARGRPGAAHAADRSPRRPRRDRTPPAGRQAGGATRTRWREPRLLRAGRAWASSPGSAWALLGYRLLVVRSVTVTGRTWSRPRR